MKLVLTIFISIVFIVNSSYAQHFQWADSFNDASLSDNNAKAIGTDGTGNVFVAGTFGGAMTIGTIPLYTNGVELYIAKYNSDVALWAYQINAPSANVYDMACDNSGNFYITGRYSGTATFGSTPPLNAGVGGSIFVAKYNTMGVCQWARTSLSFSPVNPSRNEMEKISCDNFGNCYIGGSFSRIISFGGSPDKQATCNGNPSVNTEDVYLAKFTSPSGNCDWVVNGGANSTYRDDKLGGIVVDPSGSFIYLAGSMFGTATFGTLPPLTYNPGSNGNQKMYYVKYTPSGTPIQAVMDDIEYIGSGWYPINLGIGVDQYLNAFLLSPDAITRYNSSGVFNKRTYRAPYDSGSISLKTDIDGNCYIAGTVYGTASFPPFSIVSATRSTFVAKYNNDLDAEYAITPNGSSESMGICIDQTHHAYICGISHGNTYFGSNLVNDGIYVSEISREANLISGLVYLDENLNSFDLNDRLLPYTVVSVASGSGNSFVSSGSAGEYFAYTSSAAQSVSISNPPLYYNPNPTAISIPSAPTGSTFPDQHLGLQPIPNKNDLEITLTEVARPRPGFRTSYHITYKNVGTTDLQPSDITFAYSNGILSPPQAIDISSAPLLGYTLGTNLLTWHLTSTLRPFDEGSIDVEFDVLTGTLGAHLISTATINSGHVDLTPLDNAITLNQLVRGSYDPNDKSVEPAGNLSRDYIQDGGFLTYTIRFQNTGTDEAVNIKITDPISNKLEIGSLQMITASHKNYTLKIKDNMLIWTFNNILLPDHTTNEVKSHGFIKFRIKPKNNLAEGDIITNSANIYFDFNEPVITNTTNTLVSSSKFIDLRYRLEAMYPNLDSITVSLAKSSYPNEIIESSTVYSEIINGKYKSLPSFQNTLPGSSYYIVVKHRNSIETWSANPVTFSADITTYDFTNSVSQAFGNNMILVGGLASIYSGDVNQDGVVEGWDYNDIYNDATHFEEGYLKTDLNGDGVVEGEDVIFGYNNAAQFREVMRP